MPTKSFILVVPRDEPGTRPDVIKFHRDEINCNHSTGACRGCIRDWRNDYIITR